MALPSLTQQKMQETDDIELMKYVKYSLKESVSTSLKSTMLSLQSIPAKSPLLRMLGGGILAERADIKKRELFASQGRDPNTGRKLTRAEVDEINNRRKSYGVMGEIRDSVIAIYDILENEGPKEKDKSILAAEEQASELATQNELIRKSERKFWEELFDKYFSIGGSGFVSLRSGIEAGGGGGGGGLLSNLFGAGIVAGIVALTASAAAAVLRRLGIKVPKSISDRTVGAKIGKTPKTEPIEAKPKLTTTEPEATRTKTAPIITDDEARTLLRNQIDAQNIVTTISKELETATNTANAKPTGPDVQDQIRIKNIEERLGFAKNELIAAENAAKNAGVSATEASLKVRQKIVTPEGNIPLQGAAESFEQAGKAAKMLKFLGKAVPFVGPLLMGGVGAYQAYQVSQSDMTDAQKAIEYKRIGISTGSGIVGGEIGAVLGGLVGAPFGGVGAIPGAILGSYIGAELGLAGGNYFADVYDSLFGPDASELTQEQLQRRQKLLLDTVGTPGGGGGIKYIYDEVLQSLDAQKDFFKSLGNWFIGNGFVPDASAPQTLGSNASFGNKPMMAASFTSQMPSSQQMIAMDFMRRQSQGVGGGVNIIAPTTVNNTNATSNAAISTNPSVERTGADLQGLIFRNQSAYALG